MSEPLPAWRDENEEPRPDLAPDNQTTGGIDRADRDAPTNDWFHRPTHRPALRAVPRPRAAQPPTPPDARADGSRRDRSAAPDALHLPVRDPRLANGTHPLSSTWEEIQYTAKTDTFMDILEDEQSWRDVVLFDRAVSQVVPRCPHNGLTVTMQARHSVYSNVMPFDVRALLCACIVPVVCFALRELLTLC
jgi:hypothetical protein